MREIKALTSLRFFAALYVFVFHVDMPFRAPLTYLPWRIEALVQQGRLGVTLFFILSGFVLAYAHLRDYPTPVLRGGGYYLHFMFRRVARLYPVYLLGLGLALLISFWVASPPALSLVALNVLMLQVYIPRVAMAWYSSGAWSVANEAFFYALFPLALPMLLRVRSWQVLAGLVLVTSSVGTGFGLAHMLAPGWVADTLIFAVPPFRFAEFAAGIIAALLVFKFNWSPRPSLALGLLVVAAVYLSFAGPRLHQWTSVIHNWLVVPTIVTLLAVLARPQQGRWFRWLESKPLHYLGKISYCFYIVILPLLFILDLGIAKGQINKTNVWVMPISLSIGLLLACIVHELVEKKAHNFLMGQYRRLTQRASSAQPLPVRQPTTL
jgi:peptidoglycan/LPS O-acetylase OafA/YrhL